MNLSVNRIHDSRSRDIIKHILSLLDQNRLIGENGLVLYDNCRDKKGKEEKCLADYTCLSVWIRLKKQHAFRKLLRQQRVVWYDIVNSRGNLIILRQYSWSIVIFRFTERARWCVLSTAFCEQSVPFTVIVFIFVWYPPCDWVWGSAGCCYPHLSMIVPSCGLSFSCCLPT